jgi:hypothetical protein
LAYAAISSYAQTTTWTATGVGDFTTPGNWTSGVPSSTTSAVIANGTTGTPTFVTINSGENESIFNLTVSPADYYPYNTLEINSGGQLSVFGTTITDEGLINLAAGSSNATLMLNSNVTLGGPLTYVVSLYTTGAGSAVIASSNGSKLTNNTEIQGAGIIGNSGLAVTNDGSINADVTGQTLTLNGTGLITNLGVLWATNGGTLLVTNGAVVANYSISEAEFSGSAITLSGGAVFEGGSLRALYGATMGTVGTATLDGSTIGALTLTGNYTTGGGSTTNLLGTIVNNGDMLVDGTAGSSALSLNGNTTLQGSGVVILASNSTGSAIIQQTSTALAGLYGPNQVTAATLTNKSTIQGAGIIGNGGLALTNAGTINANVAGQTLYLNGTGTIANTGLIEASNGGTLNLSPTFNVGTAVNNAGGKITVSDPSSTVRLDGADIQGGTLNNTAGGTMETFQQTTLDGSTNGALTLNGTLQITGAYDEEAFGTIINNGDLRVQGNVPGNNSGLLFGNAVLHGAGTVTLAEGPGYDIYYPPTTSLIEGALLENVSNTIQGTGQIVFTSLINDAGGTINANSSGQPLLLSNSGVTNTGLLEASNGGTLEIQNTAVNSSGGSITVSGPSSTVQFQNTTIQGGTLNNTGGGTMETVGTATLDGSTNGALTLNGTYLTGGGNTTTLLGTIINNGNLEVDGSAGNPTLDATLSFNANTTLQGGGTVTLTIGNSPSNSYNAVMSETSLDPTTGLNNVSNTIQGAGNIVVNVLNNEAGGTINANSSIAGQQLGIYGVSPSELYPLTVNNDGTMEASNVGTLHIGGPEDQSITNNGTIEARDSGTVYIDHLLAVSNNGTIAAVDSGKIYITGGIGGGSFNNSGAIGAVNSGTVDIFSTTLNNTGTIESGNSGELTIENDYEGDPTTFLTVTNTGLIQANGSSTLLIGQPANQGTVTMNNAGGNITANGPSSTVQFQNTTIQGGTLNNTGGGTMETVGTATLDGSTNGALTLNGTYLTGGGSTTTLLGTIINNGNLEVDGSAGAATLSLNGNTTLQGGGAVTLNGSSEAVIQASAFAPGVTLDNVGNTIQGAGVIGNGTAMNLVNEAGGTLLADEPGKTLLINNNGTVTNSGAMQVNFESTMHVTGNLTNFSGNTLTGGTYSVQGFGGGIGTLMIDSFGNHSGGEIVNNAAAIVLNGTSANALFVDAGGNNALAPLASNLASGSLTFEGGYNFQTDGNLKNAGVVLIGGSGSVLNIGSGGTGTYTQTGGSMTIDSGGTLNAHTIVFEGGSIQNDGTIDPVDFQVLDATLSGTGTIDGDLTNDGTVILGDSATSPGTLTVTGDYVQNSDGTLFEGIDASNSGLLSATGDVTLDGILDIALLDGFTPTNGETFELMDYTGAESGIFSTITGSDAGFWSVLLESGQVDLEFNSSGSTITNTVPDVGSTLLLFSAGLASLALFGRRGRDRIVA